MRPSAPPLIVPSVRSETAIPTGAPQARADSSSSSTTATAGRLESRERVGFPDPALRQTELEQDLELRLALRWWLRERTTQVVHRSRMGSACPGAFGGFSQDADDLAIRPRRHPEEMGSHLLGRGAGSREDVCRAPMHEDARPGVDRVVEGRAHDRVKELDRVGGTQQLGPDEPTRGVARLDELEPGERSHMAQLASVTEDRSGLGNGDGVLGETGQTDGDRA